MDRQTEVEEQFWTNKQTDRQTEVDEQFLANKQTNGQGGRTDKRTDTLIIFFLFSYL